MAYELIEPWGERRMDWRFAQLLALVFNRTSWSDKETPSKPDDWMPDPAGERKRRRKKMTVAECKASGAAHEAAKAAAAAKG